MTRNNPARVNVPKPAMATRLDAASAAYRQNVPVLVMVPGLACDGRLFRDQMPALAGVLPALLATLPTQAESIDVMAEQLLAQHPGPLVLVGASMGGMVALRAHSLAPDRVRGLALLGSSARPDSPEMTRLRNQAIELFEAGRAAEVLRANAVFAFHAAHARSLIDDYLDMVLEGGAERLVQHNRALISRPDQRPALAQVRCPTLVLCGEDDRLLPPENSRELAAGIAGADLHLLPRCGHMLTWESPRTVTSLLLDWCRRLVPAGQPAPPHPRAR